MATGRWLAAVVLLLAAARSAAGDASWADPWITAEVDKYIKTFDGDNAEITVYEDVPVGYHIFTLHVDAGQGDTVEITAHSEPAGVQLEASGSPPDFNITILTSLDYETRKDYVIKISLNAGSIQNLLLHVADVNDNPPVFSGNISSRISLDVLENTLNDSLLVLGATDADDGATAELSYFLQTSHPQLFSLNVIQDPFPRCRLQLVGELDYELTKLLKLTITVSDQPDNRGTQHWASVDVFVQVMDASDTPPVWSRPAPSKTVSDGTVKGTELFRVAAYDGDVGVNNSIDFSIVDERPYNTVVIAPESGSVVLLIDLNRENPIFIDNDWFISVTILAREMPQDQPIQPCSALTCSASVGLLRIVDAGDHPPASGRLNHSVTAPRGPTGSLGPNGSVADPVRS